MPPFILDSEGYMEEVTAVLNTTVVLQCDVTGHPAPTVSWLKDGQPLRPDSSAHLHLSEDGTQLQVGGQEMHSKA